jgi:hypothetical protein
MNSSLQTLDWAVIGFYFALLAGVVFKYEPQKPEHG